jgi:hypothetical protein
MRSKTSAPQDRAGRDLFRFFGGGDADEAMQALAPQTQRLPLGCEREPTFNHDARTGGPARTAYFFDHQPLRRGRLSSSGSLAGDSTTGSGTGVITAGIGGT